MTQRELSKAVDETLTNLDVAILAAAMADNSNDSKHYTRLLTGLARQIVNEPTALYALSRSELRALERSLKIARRWKAEGQD